MKGEEEIVEELKDLSKPMEALTASEICRKEKRKLLKKMKRKQIRKDVALQQRQEEEARLDDPEEHRKLMLKEQEEAEMVERQRKEFEERERLWIERAAKLAQEEEEEEARRKLIEEEEEKAHRKQCENENDLNEDDGWEYVEGPAEIIWQGNEIIVKKKRVRVAKRNSDHQPGIIEDADRPTSNPLPPQSEAFSSYKNTSISAKQVFESVSSQTPNFGTEQDKANCPFHIKTGACRFGLRCSRVHFYPDKSCTLLIKNMYSGPGLAWEQDEGLEHTDEEVERCYEEFYEDVHTEFLKFGEIVNFKVCRNGSFHLRGNVYVHYRSLESAMLAYHSVNGRYFAGKQITCEYVGVTRWKVAICGEYMKSRFKTCSRGTACNFIHCFHNPGGDYEWADSDKPPPKYWIKKMDALFGPSDELEHDKHKGSESRSQQRYSSKKATPKSDRYHSGRSRSTDMDYLNSSVDEDNSDENRSKLSSSSSRHKYLASARYMRSSGGDHYSRDYYVGDRERHSRLSRVRSRYSSKWEDHPNDCENSEKKYSNNDYECNEGKYRLQSDDSSRKHYQAQNRNHSVRRDHKTRISKVADLYEHARSDEYYESDDPSWCDGKYNSHDSNSRPSSETVDPCDRWEGRASSPYSNYSSDDHKPFEVKTRDQSSSGHHNKVRSTGSGRSSRKLHSKNWEEEGGSYSVGQHSEENLEYYRVKHHRRKHGSHGHKERRTQKNESSTSRESREKSNSEKEACPPCLYDDSGHHQEIHRSGRKPWKYQGNKRGKHHTEKDASTEEDEKLKVKRTSWKRSRSRSPIQCSSRSRKAR